MESDTDSEGRLIIDEQISQSSCVEKHCVKLKTYLESNSENDETESQKQNKEMFKNRNNSMPKNKTGNKSLKQKKRKAAPQNQTKKTEKYQNCKNQYVKCYAQYIKMNSKSSITNYEINLNANEVCNRDSNKASMMDIEIYQGGVFSSNQIPIEPSRCDDELKNIRDIILENKFSVKQEPFEERETSNDGITVVVDNIKKEVIRNQDEEFSDIDAFIENHFEEYFENDASYESYDDSGENEQNDSEFAGSHCKEGFKTTSSLKRHEEIHWDVTSNVCKLCGMTFEVADKLMKHMFDKHSVKDSDGISLMCPICNKRLKSPSALSHHKLVHSNVRPFLCKICKASFKEAPTLKRHMWTHLEKQHQCKICLKHFVEKHSLNRHIRTIHSDEKPNKNDEVLKCLTCRREFNTIGKFKRHNQMHGDPNFECPFCGKVYAGPSHLKIHMRIHTGEKPYKCEICSSSFTFKHVMKSHMKRMHKHISEFTCKLCSVSFTRKVELSNHFTTHLTESATTSEEIPACNKNTDRVKRLQKGLLLLNKVLPIGDLCHQT